MATLKIKHPNMVTMEFREEKTDPDYGRCAWAIFHFDLDRYTLMIESDCGNYTYGWHPTPDVESFLHLMGRLDEGYLLDKLSDRTVVDTEETWKAAQVYLKSVEVEAIERYPEDDENEHKLTDEDWNSICNACRTNSGEICYHDLLDALEYSPLDGEFYGFELRECINYTYPARAKSIVSIFMQYIRPKCQEISKEEEV